MYGNFETQKISAKKCKEACLHAVHENCFNTYKILYKIDYVVDLKMVTIFGL